MWQITGILAVFTVIIGLAFGGYFYWSQGQLADLHKQTAELSIQVEESSKRIENMEILSKEIATNLQSMSQSFNQIAKDSQDSVNILRSHDLDKIIEDRPDSFERVINDGVERANKELMKQTHRDNYVPTKSREKDEKVE